jgi:xylulose-5-phosphate/fructose-6-phosphate phosphoketolase
MIYICGPGHGDPGMVANTYLEGTYTALFPNITEDSEFSFPGGIPSHAAPETPGSINEGGEFGYSLLHAYGSVFDNPDLIACVIGDGEAETGGARDELALQQIPDPERDRAVLPILHLKRP